ncbi:unnamed protein product [Trifolium pratense]|uniref:Uncharacterized protein n=1 Tax=Trifolium pratense TaxID=57577 RepID=A0ACB0L011_TRIPR|nr:unnamed protein product [Trifolium pratense]
MQTYENKYMPTMVVVGKIKAANIMYVRLSMVSFTGASTSTLQLKDQGCDFWVIHNGVFLSLVSFVMFPSHCLGMLLYAL